LLRLEALALDPTVVDPPEEAVALEPALEPRDVVDPPVATALPPPEVPHDARKAQAMHARASFDGGRPTRDEHSTVI
jgi:hypothetical protein